MSKTIMVVDDEKRLVSLVESYLTQEGYRVVTANNGKEALTVSRREKPDLIVLDVIFAIRSAFELNSIAPQDVSRFPSRNFSSSNCVFTPSFN